MQKNLKINYLYSYMLSAANVSSPISQQTLGPTAKLAVSDAVSDAALGPAL